MSKPIEAAERRDIIIMVPSYVVGVNGSDYGKKKRKKKNGRQ